MDATPFKTWYEQHYGVKISARKGSRAAANAAAAGEKTEEVKRSAHLTRKLEARQKTRVIDSALEDAMVAGKVLACISSRPGQSGRCDGYVLEGKELEFYSKKLKNKKGSK